MSLLAIKQFLKQSQGVSLAELCFHFDYEPDTLRDMLKLWVEKGMVRCWKKTSKCGGSCFRCDAASTEMYCWQ